MRKWYSLFIVLIFAGYVSAQISPGDLTKAHAKYEGMSNCTKCHILGEKVNSSKCLDCHSEIKHLISANTGYHSSVEVKGKNCWDCHSEHNGRNFRIINFDKNKFDHNKTTFPLTGKHAKADCSSCHQYRHIKDAELKKRGSTYLGLDKNCRGCHEDFHQNTLGNNCEDCHDNESFKPAPKFNHNKAEFKLSGSHIEVKCINCHPREKKQNKDFQRFKGILFTSCANCHKDVHEGKFGANCQSCHVTGSFKEINKKSFNHDKTGFPLLGKHSIVSCDDCHKKNFTVSLNYKNCTDCHKDYHKREFTDNGQIKECSVCHTVQGFKPSSYTIEKHNELKFPLTGSHLAVPCEGCHYKNNEWSFKVTDLKCISCHQNVHKNEITAEFMPGENCAHCHQTKTWAVITFDHNKTKFPLLGKHSDVKCGSCHYKDKKEFKFATLDTNCETCHKDIHFGQFKKGTLTDCIQCHSYNNWKPDKFDHNKTKFSLEGAHQKLKCSGCHKMIEVSGNSFIKYKLEDFKCASCHS